jgi:hypothetical protein
MVVNAASWWMQSGFVINQTSMLAYFLASVINFGLFLDGYRRMLKVFIQIPVLKKSERVFLTLIMIYSVLLVSGIIGLASYFVLPLESDVL